MNKAVAIGVALLTAFAADAQQTAVTNTPQATAVPGAANGNDGRISAEDFGALPFMVNPLLSPDGKKIATGVTIRGRDVIAIVDLNAQSAVTDRVATPENYDLNWYQWAGNSRVLISVGQAALFLGEDTYVTRLLMYDLATKKISFVGKSSEGVDGDNVIYTDRDGRSVLLSVQKTIYDYPSVWSIDLDTLAMKEVVKQQPDVWVWSPDSNGVVRVGLGSAGNRWWALYRKKDGEKFQKAIKRSLTKEDEGTDVEILVPRVDGDYGYAVANKNTGRFGLYRFDFATDTLGETIFEHPHVDIDDFKLSDNGAVEAVYYTDDRSRVEWLDPKMKQIQADIDQAMPNRINRVTSVSRDGGRMIVWTGSSSDPGRFYVYEHELGTMAVFSKPYDKITGKQLAVMESTSYPARDGLTIPAYLTLPRGREAKGLPLIMMPHGGPFARDVWGYDVYAQFLANRGYAVLQPNFRGSTGYGKAFVEKGIGQWGRGMQDDLDDGVKWLVEQGKVDAKRVCIMGGSYGGYAAMWAATKSADIYRCAISFAGVSDMSAMVRYQQRMMAAPRYFRDWRERVKGDKKFDLDSISPLRAVDRIAMPMLIAHGDRDDTVPVVQSKKLHDAMTKANKPHEYVIYEGERHGFQKVENSVDYLKRVEAFLDKHNPAE